jgi:hypothetical protein
MGTGRRPTVEESVSLRRRLLAVILVAIGAVPLLYVAFLIFRYLLNHLVGVSIAAAVAVIIGSTLLLYFLIKE